MSDYYEGWGNNQSLSTQTQSEEPEPQGLQTISPEHYMSLARQGMGLIERIKFNRNNKKEIAMQAKDIALSLLSKQREAIEHQMELGLSITKRQQLNAYKNEMMRIDASVIRAEQEATSQLTSYIEIQITEMFKNKKSHTDNFQRMAESGEIDSEDVAYLNGVVKDFAYGRAGDMKFRLEALLKYYSDSYIDSLKQARSRIVESI